MDKLKSNNFKVYISQVLQCIGLMVSTQLKYVTFNFSSLFEKINGTVIESLLLQIFYILEI